MKRSLFSPARLPFSAIKIYLLGIKAKLRIQDDPEASDPLPRLYWILSHIVLFEIAVFLINTAGVSLLDALAVTTVATVILLCIMWQVARGEPGRYSSPEAMKNSSEQGDRLWHSYSKKAARFEGFPEPGRVTIKKGGRYSEIPLRTFQSEWKNNSLISRERAREEKRIKNSILRVRYGKKHTREMVLAALKASEANADLCELPHGESAGFLFANVDSRIGGVGEIGVGEILARVFFGGFLFLEAIFVPIGLAFVLTMRLDDWMSSFPLNERRILRILGTISVLFVFPAFMIIGARVADWTRGAVEKGMDLYARAYFWLERKTPVESIDPLFPFHEEGDEILYGERKMVYLGPYHENPLLKNQEPKVGQTLVGLRNEHGDIELLPFYKYATYAENQTLPKRIENGRHIEAQVRLHRSTSRQLDNV